MKYHSFFTNFGLIPFSQDRQKWFFKVIVFPTKLFTKFVELIRVSIFHYYKQNQGPLAPWASLTPFYKRGRLVRSFVVLVDFPLMIFCAVEFQTLMKQLHRKYAKMVLKKHIRQIFQILTRTLDCFLKSYKKQKLS